MTTLRACLLEKKITKQGLGRALDPCANSTSLQKVFFLKNINYNIYLHYSDVLTNILCTCTVMVTLLVLSEASIELFPVHVYTPSCVGYWASTMWSVDITFPGVTILTKVPSICLTPSVVPCVIISVWLNVVVWLLNVHVMLGTGPPVDLQEMFTLFPSEMVTFSSCPSVNVVLVFSIKISSQVCSIKNCYIYVYIYFLKYVCHFCPLTFSTGILIDLYNE